MKTHEFMNMGRAQLVRRTANAVCVLLLEKEGETLWVPRRVLASGSKLEQGKREGRLIVESWWAEQTLDEWERREELSAVAHERALGQHAPVARGASIGGQRLIRRRSRAV